MYTFSITFNENYTNKVATEGASVFIKALRTL